jgi:hypothetical protein
MAAPVAMSQWTTVASASVSTRPIPEVHQGEMIASKQAFIFDFGTRSFWWFNRVTFG